MTDGRQTITLRFPLNAANVIISRVISVSIKPCDIITVERSKKSSVEPSH